MKLYRTWIQLTPMVTRKVHIAARTLKAARAIAKDKLTEGYNTTHSMKLVDWTTLPSGTVIKDKYPQWTPEL